MSVRQPQAPHAASADLGPDLGALLEALGTPLRRVVPLSWRGAAGAATAFRLHFADGTTLKGCRLASVAQAEKAAAVVSLLGGVLGGCVPRLIGQRGAAMLSEWVEGKSLAEAGCDDALRRACGAAQGRLHAAGLAIDPIARRHLAPRWLRDVTGKLEALRAAAVLTPAAVTAATLLARANVPPHCDGGAVFGDYCAENIVQRPDGVLCLIDIETVATGPYDFDLARTGYRWPMSDREWAVYLNGYRLHRDPAPFVAHRPFWDLAAVVDSLIFRHRYRPADLAVPLAAFAALVGGAEADGAPGATTGPA